MSVFAEQTLVDDSLSDLHRFRGDPEAAWRSKLKTINRFAGIADGELLAFRPYYDKLFGQSPGYRAYMSKIAGKP